MHRNLRTRTTLQVAAEPGMDLFGDDREELREGFMIANALGCGYHCLLNLLRKFV